MSNEQYLVVVSILEGRKFPKRGKHQLVVETRFDGEHLATDPVSHGESPEFNTELAWELSKKALHQHRLQRTPIKLQCYAVDQFSKSKENIGYVMLDLRTAAFLEPSPAKVPVTSKWYSLLSTKYNRHKPELKIGISLETDAQGHDESFKAKSAPPRKGQAPGTEEYPEDPETDLKYLQPILHDTDGYYQIGPPDICTESFVLSITIAYAAHLAQLVPSDRPLPAKDSGFFFYYSLFGNEVTNEAFRDLLNPNFAAERASVRLRSSVRALYAFLNKEGILQVHLCCGDKSLGSADIPFTSFLVQDTSAINRHPLTVEGSFRLVPPALIQQRLPPVDGSQAPCVGVSVALRREEMPLPTGGVKPPMSQPTPSQQHLPAQQPPPPTSTPPRHQQPSKKTVSPHDSPPEKLARPATKHPDVSLTSLDNGSGTEGDVASLEDEEEDGGRTGRHREDRDTGPSEPHRPAADSKPTQPQKHTAPQGAQSQKHPPQGEGVSTSTSSHAQVVVDAAAHHFSFSIDLRRIKDVDTTGALNIYLRYSYPFFGSSAPIMTHPPVEVRKHTEVLLPHSFCAFDFATTHHQLRETLFRVPLLVEVWHRDSYSKDVLLGIARVSLAGILGAEKARVASAHVGGPEGWRQICSERAYAETTEGKPVRVAELMVVLGLEDYGPIRAQQFIMGADKSQTSTSASARGAPPPPPQDPVEPPDPRETAEYKAAMELEMWKEQQAGNFEHELKEKELQYMQSLAEEWKRRDKEREILVKKKTDEYNHLEDQLRNALADIDKRERQLAANESEVVRLRQDLQREHDHQLTELKEASRRMKEDCVHQVQIEKSKVHLLEEEKHRLAEQLAEAQQQLQQRDQEFQEFRRQLSSKPEVKLQSELNLLTLEKVELERKLESITKSKIHYKQQWGRALKELARLKQREHTEAQSRLKRQQQELEHMRLRYLAAEEKEVVKSEKKELEDIKGELDRLKQQEQNKQQQPQQDETTDHKQRDTQRHRTAHTSSQQKENIGPDMHNLDSSMDEHVARLIEERDTLLRTGVYTHQDRIITELDRQIREAITRQGTS